MPGTVRSAFRLLAALVPPLLPLAAWTAHLQVPERVELTLVQGSNGVMATERRWGLTGAMAPQVYGPVMAATAGFIRAPMPLSDPAGLRQIPVMVLSTPDGDHYPFAGMTASGQDIAPQVMALDAGMMTSQADAFLRRRRTEPLVIERSQSYPPMLWLFDAFGLFLAMAILRLWTLPLLLGPAPRAPQAAPKQAAG